MYILQVLRPRSVLTSEERSISAPSNILGFNLEDGIQLVCTSSSFLANYPLLLGWKLKVRIPGSGQNAGYQINNRFCFSQINSHTYLVFKYNLGNTKWRDSWPAAWPIAWPFSFWSYFFFHALLTFQSRYF